MSRYVGARIKVMRAVGVDLPGLSAKSMEKRPYPPGQHGHARRKLSEYAVRVLETKKLRMNYGLSEHQLRRLVVEAHGSQRLLELIERRLDNVVFRAGFARTIPSARQLVCHGHIHVNGKRVDIASFRVSPGDEIVWKTVPAALPDPRFAPPEWMTVTRDNATAKITANPDGTSALFPLDLKLVIEHYAKRL